jgi:hypothetical protein
MAAAAVDISSLLAWEAANTPLPPSERLAEECQACARALDAALKSDGLLRLRFAKDKDGEGRPTADEQWRGGEGETETAPGRGEAEKRREEKKEGSKSSSAAVVESAVGKSSSAASLEHAVEESPSAAVLESAALGKSASAAVKNSEEMLDAARSLFALSAEEKQAAAADVSQRPGFVRGYLGMGAESGLAAMHEPKVRRQTGRGDNEMTRKRKREREIHVAREKSEAGRSRAEGLRIRERLLQANQATTIIATKSLLG